MEPLPEPAAPTGRDPYLKQTLLTSVDGFLVFRRAADAGSINCAPQLRPRLPHGPIDFLRLPLNVRHLIYREAVKIQVAFCDKCYRVAHDRLVVRVTDGKRQRTYPRLAWTCKQVREEVLDVFYSEVTFDVLVSDMGLKELIDWLDTLGSRAALLRHVCLHFHCRSFHQTEMKRLLLYHEKLKQCTFTCHGNTIQAKHVFGMLDAIDYLKAHGKNYEDIELSWRVAKFGCSNSYFRDMTESNAYFLCNLSSTDPILDCIPTTLDHRDFDDEDLGMHIKPNDAYACDGNCEKYVSEALIGSRAGPDGRLTRMTTAELHAAREDIIEERSLEDSDSEMESGDDSDDDSLELDF